MRVLCILGLLLSSAQVRAAEVPSVAENPTPIVAFVLKHTGSGTPSAIVPESPSEYQIYQRSNRGTGTMRLRGLLTADAGQLRCRLVGSARQGNPTPVVQDWQAVASDLAKGRFDAAITAPAGGWYCLELRLEHEGRVLAETAIEHVGVGEIFVVAGQSNSTNYGSEKQQTATGMVASFDGIRWVLAQDPQPGVQDGSKGGSFLPAFGDALYEKYRVPIGVASTGAGATSVRQWLPKGERMQNRPTIAAHVRSVGPGEWESTGTLFDGLMKRIGALGPHGCRAVLWHQGESDAGQARAGYPADRQITGPQYRAFLEKLLRATRQRAGWDIPWFVAQATYHSENDPADDEFRAAQKALWGSGLAQEGPDTDALRKAFRAGVHFNGKGQQAHGRLWAEKVGVYLDQLTEQGAPTKPRAPIPGKDLKMSQDLASSFARLALKGIQKEYPNKPGDVLNSVQDIKGPQAVHPAFFGSFDWHSSVHGHWMLVRLLRLFPELPEKQEIRSALAEHLTAKHLQAEANYFARPNSQSFERPYGWAWLLKLAEELHGWDDPEAKQWSKNLKPLTDQLVARYLTYFPKQTYPIRSGVHPNTAFGLAFALDYAQATGNKPLQELIEERSRTYFAQDAGIPAAWEPDGADFFSPSLMEADLMRRVLYRAEFQTWFQRFLPNLAHGEPRTLLEPAKVTDRSDPQIVHLDGLNLSRAWCMRSIATALPKDDPARKVLAESATRHAEAALRHVASGDYVGEHWLASFAVYLLSTPSPE
jgi:hypothetical protein